MSPAVSRFAAFALLAVALLTAWTLLVEPYRALLAAQEAELRDGRDRLGHLTRIAATVPELAAALERVGANGEAAADPHLSGASEALAAATLQSRLGALAERAGMAITAVEPTQAADAATTGRVALTVSLNGSIDGVRRLLHAIESDRPLLFVEELDLLNPSVSEARFDPSGHVLLGARIRVAGFRRVP